MKFAIAGLLIFTLITSASANEPVVSPESLNRFLSGVHDFADGKLTPGPLYDPQSVVLPSGGGTVALIPNLPTTIYHGMPAQPTWRAFNGALTGGWTIRYPTATRAVGLNSVRQSTLRHR